VVPPRNEGVAELVQEDREEEQRRARDRENVRGRAVVGFVQDVPVEAAQPEDDQEEDDEPRVIDRDPDPANAKERYAAAAHGLRLVPGLNVDWETRIAFPDRDRGRTRDLDPARRCLDARAPGGGLRDRTPFCFRGGTAGG